MADYAATSTGLTNTQSSTLPSWNLFTVTTARRAELYEYITGPQNDGAAVAVYRFQRTTAPGTSGGNVTAVPLESTDAAASASLDIATYSGGPTLTANAFLLTLPVHQRATFRWIANPRKELKIPATNNAGIACLPTLVTTAWNTSVTVYFSE